MIGALERVVAQFLNAQVVTLYNNPSVWNAIRQGGFENINSHFSTARAAEGILQTLQLAFANNDLIKRRIARSLRGISMLPCGA